ncbi:MAG: LLM class flavin-dependent oxidoreductase, partial [Polyangiaceae bacterium]|nr:LLM class flavin-dependent oxidoreductase [Polyangiaceae bacterium]
KVFAREEALTYEGERFQIPFRGEGSTGQGKPLKSMLHSRRDIPIFTGSMAPKSQEMSAELADGCLLTCMSPEKPGVLMQHFERGFEKSGDPQKRERFEIVPTVGVRIEDDLEKAYEPFRQQLCLYVGGMGSRNKNFYKDYLVKVGFEGECEKIQSLFLEGKRAEALAAVPDAMIDAVHLVGSKARIKDRLQRYQSSPVTTLLVGAADLETLRFMAEANS